MNSGLNASINQLHMFDQISRLAFIVLSKPQHHKRKKTKAYYSKGVIELLGDHSCPALLCMKGSHKVTTTLYNQ
jgi:hypothetical protein